MEDSPIQIKFVNQANSASAFDLIKMEDLLRREYVDHNPEELHRVEFYIILFITSGQGSHKIDFTEYEYSSGSLLTIRKDQIHQFSNGRNAKGYLLLFKEDFLISYLEIQEAQKSLQLFNELLADPKIQLRKDEFNMVMEIIKKVEHEYFNIMDDHSLGIIRSELHILITKLFRLKSEKVQVIFQKKYLGQFIEFQKLVEQHAFETTKVIDYARMLHVSTKTLNNITKSIIHKSAKELIDEICIVQIKRLLINTSLSVKEIAYNSGFTETTNFFKYFKRHVNMTPEAYRATI